MLETSVQHYRASFSDPWMWSPLAVTPPLVGAGVAGAFSPRIARRVLPVAGALYAAGGLLGLALHGRGVQRRPGGWRLARYNVPMGPSLLTPALMSILGAMAIAAGAARRER
jgi:hypothetical protein